MSRVQCRCCSRPARPVSRVLAQFVSRSAGGTTTKQSTGARGNAAAGSRTARRTRTQADLFVAKELGAELPGAASGCHVWSLTSRPGMSENDLSPAKFPPFSEIIHEESIPQKKVLQIARPRNGFLPLLNLAAAAGKYWLHSDCGLRAMGSRHRLPTDCAKCDMSDSTNCDMSTWNEERHGLMVSRDGLQGDTCRPDRPAGRYVPP